MTKRKNLFVPGKRSYILGTTRPKVDCILCSVLDDSDDRVKNLLVWRDAIISVSANLYPYNAGHLLIFPIRHIADLRELTEKEANHFHLVTKKCMDILDEVYEPKGFNIGFNIGDASGASIEHLHQHMIPRYPKELGFVDIVTGTKIIIEDPNHTMVKLKSAFQAFSI